MGDCPACSYWPSCKAVQWLEFPNQSVGGVRTRGVSRLVRLAPHAPGMTAVEARQSELAGGSLQPTGFGGEGREASSALIVRSQISWGDPVAATRRSRPRFS